MEYVGALCAGEEWYVAIMALKVRIEDISLRMLAPTLRQLEQDGFLSRTVRPTNPPRVEYALPTANARDIAVRSQPALLNTRCDWARTAKYDCTPLLAVALGRRERSKATLTFGLLSRVTQHGSRQLAERPLASK